MPETLEPDIFQAFLRKEKAAIDAGFTPGAEEYQTAAGLQGDYEDAQRMLTRARKFGFPNKDEWEIQHEIEQYKQQAQAYDREAKQIRLLHQLRLPTNSPPRDVIGSMEPRLSIPGSKAATPLSLDDGSQPQIPPMTSGLGVGELEPVTSQLPLTLFGDSKLLPIGEDPGMSGKEEPNVRELGLMETLGEGTALALNQPSRIYGKVTGKPVADYYAPGKSFIPGVPEKYWPKSDDPWKQAAINAVGEFGTGLRQFATPENLGLAISTAGLGEAAAPVAKMIGAGFGIKALTEGVPEAAAEAEVAASQGDIPGVGSAVGKAGSALFAAELMRKAAMSDSKIIEKLHEKKLPVPHPAHGGPSQDVKGGMQMPKFNILGMKVNKPRGGEEGYGLNPFVDNSPRPFKELSTKDLQDLLEQGKDALANMEKMISDAGITAEDRQHPIWAKSASNKALEDVQYTMDYIQAELLKRKKQGPGNVGMGSQSGIAAAPGFPSDDELQRLRETPVPDLQAQHDTLSQGIANFKAGRFPPGFRPEDAQRWIQNWTASARVIKDILDETKQVGELRNEIARKKLVERAVRPTLPVSDPIGNPTLENITGLSPEAHFEVVNNWIDQVMDRLDRENMTPGEILQAQGQARETALRENAQKAATVHPNLDNWQSALDKTQADLNQVRQEVAAAPQTSAARAMEIVALAERRDFLRNGANHLRQINEVREAIGPTLHDAPGTKLLMDKYGPNVNMHKAVNGLDGINFPRVAKQYLRSIKAKGTVEEVSAVLKDMAEAARLNRPISAVNDPNFMNDASIAKYMGGDVTPLKPHAIADSLNNPVYLMNERQYELFTKSPTAAANAQARGFDGVIVDKPNGDVINALRFPQQLPPEGGGTAPPAQPPTAPPPPAGGTTIPIKHDPGASRDALNEIRTAAGLEPIKPGQQPPPAGPGEASQSTVPPPVTGEVSAQVGGAEPPPTPPAISKPTTPPTTPSSSQAGGLIPPLEPLIEKALPTVKKAYAKLDELRKQAFDPIVTPKKVMIQKFDAADTQAHVTARQITNKLRLEENPIKRRAAYVMIEASDPTLGAAAVGGPKLNVSMLQEFRKIAKESGDKNIIAAVNYAFNNRFAPRFQQYVQRARAILDAQNNREVSQGLNPSKDNPAYMPHYYEGPLKLATGQPVMIGSKPGVVSGRALKGNDFPNMFAAMKEGYRPQSIDIADVLEHRIRQGERILNQRAWVKQFEQVNDPQTKTPIMLSSDAPEAMKQGYASMELQPGVRVAVHPTYKRVFNALTQDSAWRNSVVGDKLLSFESGLKHKLLAFDTYHWTRMLARQSVLHTGSLGGVREALHDIRVPLIKRSVGDVLGDVSIKGPGYRKGHSLLEWGEGDVQQAFRRGEITKDERDYIHEHAADAKLLLENGLNVGRISENFYKETTSKFAKVFRALEFPVFKKYVFEKVTRGAMMESALIELDRVQKNTGMSREQAAQKVARDLNVYFGNIQRQGLFPSKTAQDTAQVFFLAPQWVESMARTELGAARLLTEPLGSGKAQGWSSLPKGVIQGLIAYYVGAQIINYVTRGHGTWDNPEQDHKFDAWIPDVTDKNNKRGLFMPTDAAMTELISEYRRFSQQKGGGPFDVESGSYAGGRILFNKLSPLARAATIAVSGHDVDRRKLIGVDRWIGAALGLIPAPIGVSPAVQQAEEAIGARPHTGIHPLFQFQRSLMGSLGMKTDYEPTKVIQAYQLVRDWKKNNSDPRIYQKWRRDEQSVYPQSEYHDLRVFLAMGDYKAARKEYAKLGRTPEQVERALSPFTGTQIGPGTYRRQPRPAYTDKAFVPHQEVTEAINHFKPLGGLTDQEEEKFYNTLTPAQRDTYDKAKMERLLLYQRLHESFDPANDRPTAETLEPKPMPQ